MNNLALGIIDAQRGFMPASEGLLLGLPGFGELPVPNGETVVPNINRLLAGFAARGLHRFTTQDWHPRNTAHFSDNPDFATTWPVHCVAGTPGALRHPEIKLPKGTYRFVKGDEALVDGADDKSYSAYYSHIEDGPWMTAWLLRREIRWVALGGLALDYCVGRTALDFRTKLGLEVSVIADASAGISNQSVASMYDEFAKAGIEVTSTEQVLARIEAEGK